MIADRGVVVERKPGQVRTKPRPCPRRQLFSHDLFILYYVDFDSAALGIFFQPFLGPPLEGRGGQNTDIGDY